MKSALLCLFTASVSFTAVKPGDPAVNWTLFSGYQQAVVNGVSIIQACDPAVTGCTRSAIFGDAAGTSATYVANSAGVTDSVIHFSSSTYDATLSFVQGSSRTLTFNFGAQLALNPLAAQPAWSTQLVNGHGLLNVSHILWPTTALGDTTESDYTTRLTTAVPGNNAYHLRMNSKNPLPDVNSTSSYYGDATFDYNDPYQTALVHVHHCPAGASSQWCPAGHKESWYVYPDLDASQTSLSGSTQRTTGLAPSQVGTLVQDTSRGGLTGIGQYSMPFFFKIELQ